MTTSITIGTAKSKPGKIVYGAVKGVGLPTGGSDDFPIIIAQGKADGPVFWVTGSIHGNEYSGLSVIHKLLGPGGADFPLGDLRGTVVLVPTLSPAGVRTAARSPYYAHGADPNRMFPAPKHMGAKDKVKPKDDDSPPSALERAFERLFAYIEANGDYLIDLHNAVIGSIPFSFRDPVYYEGEDQRDAALELQVKTDEMLEAFGMPIVNEFPSAEYIKKDLHRSVSGSVLNRARRPAFTVELGSYLYVDVPARDGAVVGLRNVMRWAGMLPGDLEPMPAIPQPKVDYPVRRMMHPRVSQSGVVTHLVMEGDLVKKGDTIARLTDIYGRPLGPEDGLLRSEHDGYVVGLLPGTVYYENEPVIWMSVRDDNEMLLPYPSELSG